MRKSIQRASREKLEILKQKERYLGQDDLDCSLVNLERRRTTDLERVLLDWAKTMVRDTVSALEWRAKVIQEHNDLSLTHAIILEKAQAFALGTNVPNQDLTLGWVERFRSQNDLGGARPPRSSSAVDGAESLPLAGLSSNTAFALSSVPPQATIRESKIDSQGTPRQDNVHDKIWTSDAGFASGSAQEHQHGITNMDDGTLLSDPHSPLLHSSGWDSGAAPTHCQYFPLEHAPTISPFLTDGNFSDSREETDRAPQLYTTGESFNGKIAPTFVGPPMLVLPSEDGQNSRVIRTVRVAEPTGQQFSVAPCDTTMASHLLRHQCKYGSRPELSTQLPDSRSLPRAPEEFLRALETLSRYLQEQPQSFLEDDDRTRLGNVAKKLKVQLHAS
ncbi:hypothetical protein LTR01_008924 [Friedmanniomyces endolithicus]|nr:hypothetical protein LTR01_008924 [Friedmanniomyces endolithicus]KAK0822874.1 hypothetical protein LTR73_008962 [Friedmanniomyces endolithicus]